ncbi:tetratricopeptide repeat-containing sensor histidine kinase [Limnovirga soli]|uniref:Tetratricopeptide repeat protein n=1 Tax=Limnovirga soli TaxID=2656915 RepID=A0A8J8FJJ6_9BACT|nr:histidine kinase [Limnovirga soli]NNV57509.1 hypothetical protein [Limnovirga soli]
MHMFNGKRYITFLLFALLFCTGKNLQAQQNANYSSIFTAGEAKWFKRELPAAIQLLQLYISKTGAATDSNDIINANDLLANIYLTKSNYDSALYFSAKCMEALNKISNKRLLPNYYQTKARIYNQLGEMENTILYFSIADSLYAIATEKILRDQGVYTAAALGSIFQEQHQYEKSAEYYQLAVQRAANQPTRCPLLQSLEALANLYIDQKEYAKATPIFYTKLFTEPDTSDYCHVYAYAYLDMGDIHSHKGNADSAYFYYQKAIGLFYSSSEYYKLDAAYIRLATINFKKGNITAAKQFCDSTLEWAYRNNNLKQAIDCYQLLADISIQQNQFESAVLYLQKKEKCSDSLLNLKNLEASNNLYIINKVKEKDQSIAALNFTNNLNQDLIKKRETINYLLAGLLVVLLVLFTIYLNRLRLKRQLDKQNAVAQERERIIADLHDDIGATLSSMHIYGDLAQQVWFTQPEASKDMVAKITVQSKELMTRMGDIIWSMKPPDEEKHSFTARLKNYSNELLAAKNIECEFNIDETLSKKIIRPQVRRNILLIAKEAMNNIAKYSHATTATVVLTRQNETLLLTISDNGIGYHTENTIPGNGLNNIQRRCRQLNGGCSIQSIPGSGVTIDCTFPIATISHTL